MPRNTRHRRPTTKSFSKSVTRDTTRRSHRSYKIEQQNLLNPTKDSSKPSNPYVIIPNIEKPRDDSLEDFLNKLARTGGLIENPTYIYSRYMMFMYIYLIKKYSSSCALFNHEYFFHGEVLNYNYTQNKILYQLDLGKQLRDCIDRGTQVIFITLFINDDDHVHEHVNLLIYRPFKKVIERYEPHGRKTGIQDHYFSDDKLNIVLRKLVEQVLKPDLEQYTPEYRTPADICIHPKGFQGIESKAGKNEYEDGYCQFWIMFMMETILMNPTLNTVDIINRCLVIGYSDPIYFRFLIRGYKSIISKEIRFYFRKHIKHKMGSAEAKIAFSKIDARELVESTLAETKQRVHPHPRIEDEHKSIIDTLDVRDIAAYIDFIETGILFNDIVMKDKPLKWYRINLAVMMSKEKLTWRELNHKMFLYYFRSIRFGEIEHEFEKCWYFLNWKEYPPDGLIMFYKNLKINNTKLMDTALQQYLNFVDFDRALTESKQITHRADSEETIMQELDKLSPLEVVELYALIQYRRGPTDDEMIKVYDDKSVEHEEVVGRFLIENNLNIVDLIHMNTMLK